MTTKNKLTEALDEVVSHHIDIITDSDWFEDFIEQKIKKIIKQNKLEVNNEQ
jgi:hypothetical protein